MNKAETREKARSLRAQGMTYGQIRKALREEIPKSTLSYWSKDIPLPRGFGRKIKSYNLFHLKRAQKIAREVNKKKREEYIFSLFERNRHLTSALAEKNTAKIALAMLYFGEGSKTQRGSLVVGNSSLGFIQTFLGLLRYCYEIDERKFRCTVQCRADQNIPRLERFWSQATGIPPSRFYAARIDPRTIGKRSVKKDYMGVCRIDYFSADTHNELMAIIKLISESKV